MTGRVIRPEPAATLTARQLAGAAALDAAPALWHLASGNWLRLKNRHEHLTRNPSGPGWRCEFEWSSALHAVDVFPALGELLLHSAFKHWPIKMLPLRPVAKAPAVSFVLPFRGRKRLPQLLATLQSIAGQVGIDVEAVVVEQDQQHGVRADLPAWVSYLHLPHPQGDTRWRKCWAFNAGVQAARGDVLICHDADILCPAHYALTAKKLLEQGYGSAFPQRFLFYLNQPDSEGLYRSAGLRGIRPESVKQNWVGGTVAITRKHYAEIGGFDERFCDWTGEDVEFFDRCRARDSYRYGFIPFVHLWHESQPTKLGELRDNNLQEFREVMKIPAIERIRRLTSGGVGA